MKETPVLLQSARARLRRVEARLQRYPHDNRLQRLRREARFRVEELEAYLEEQGAPVIPTAASRAPSSGSSLPTPVATSNGRCP
jgi:hypothetical protein